MHDTRVKPQLGKLSVVNTTCLPSKLVPQPRPRVDPFSIDIGSDTPLDEVWGLD